MGSDGEQVDLQMRQEGEHVELRMRLVRVFRVGNDWEQEWGE